MDMNHWQYITANVLVVCATLILIVSILTHTVIPETIISPALLIVSAVFSYIYGNRQTNSSGKT